MDSGGPGSISPEGIQVGPGRTKTSAWNDIVTVNNSAYFGA